MIPQRTKSSILAAVLIGAVTSPAMGDEILAFSDEFESLNAPHKVWLEVQGCPFIETQAIIEGSQSLKLELWPQCHGGEPSLICNNYAASETASVFLKADLRGLQLASQSTFELLSLLNEQNRRRKALTVKLGQDGSQTWVRIEAMEDGENVVVSPQHGVDDLLQGGEVELHLTWSRGVGPTRLGATRLNLRGVFRSLSIRLDDLVNRTFTPDYVALGVAEAELRPGSTGGFLVDNFELWSSPIENRQ